METKPAPKEQNTYLITVVTSTWLGCGTRLRRQPSAARPHCTAQVERPRHLTESASPRMPAVWKDHDTERTERRRRKIMVTQIPMYTCVHDHRHREPDFGGRVLPEVSACSE